MFLWLDDTRNPVEHGYIGWTWVKSAVAAFLLLKSGKVLKASLDHDLDEHASIGLPPKEPTGHDLLCWMERHNIWPIGGVSVHSRNIEGKARMQAVIDRHYR